MRRVMVLVEGDISFVKEEEEGSAVVVVGLVEVRRWGMRNGRRGFGVVRVCRGLRRQRGIVLMMSFAICATAMEEVEGCVLHLQDLLRVGSWAWSSHVITRRERARFSCESGCMSRTLLSIPHYIPPTRVFTT